MPLTARSPLYSRIRGVTNLTYEQYIKQYVNRDASAVQLVQNNLPIVHEYTQDLKELEDAHAAYNIHGERGTACGLTHPITGNIWVFDEAGSLVYMQLSARAVWVEWLRHLCRFYIEDKYGYWQPPSLDAMGPKEWFKDKNERLKWM